MKDYVQKNKQELESLKWVYYGDYDYGEFKAVTAISD